MVAFDRLVGVDTNGYEHQILILSKDEAAYPDREWLKSVAYSFAQKQNLTISEWNIYYYGQLTTRETKEVQARRNAIKAS